MLHFIRTLRARNQTKTKQTDTKNKLAHEIATMAEKAAHEAAMAQVEVNKMEAQHRSLFVAGWRPFIGWTFVIRKS